MISRGAMLRAAFRHPRVGCPSAERLLAPGAALQPLWQRSTLAGVAAATARRQPCPLSRAPAWRRALASLPRHGVEEVEVAAPRLMQADARVVLVCGALLCFAGSLTAVYVAVTHDPNRKEDRPALRRGEYIAGASVVGACALVVITLRGGK
mmetsp:Transcript_147/g.268  ORF Transcript_147/g.268 Transcript_147/m.268 type:complete len:152 (-) Transcript_147:134-589(-)